MGWSIGLSRRGNVAQATCAAFAVSPSMPRGTQQKETEAQLLWRRQRHLPDSVPAGEAHPAPWTASSAAGLPGTAAQGCFPDGGVCTLRGERGTCRPDGEGCTACGHFPCEACEARARRQDGVGAQGKRERGASHRGRARVRGGSEGGALLLCPGQPAGFRCRQNGMGSEPSGAWLPPTHPLFFHIQHRALCCSLPGSGLRSLASFWPPSPPACPPGHVLAKSSPVIQVPAHHVMAEQGPGPPAAQRGLPVLGGHQGHAEAVLHTGRPRQELLQGRQVEADGPGGVLVIVSNWSEEDAEGTTGLLMREPEAGSGQPRPEPQGLNRETRRS